MKDVTRETLDRLTRTACRRMYGGKCRRCRVGWAPMEVSHFIRRANIATRWSPLNTDLLCKLCHAILQQNWKGYQSLKRRLDGDITVFQLCSLNGPAAYKPHFTAQSFRLATHEALTELLSKELSGLYLRLQVFQDGLGVVSIPPVEVAV